ncbi:DUF5677 domain-containing protein [Rhizobium sp. RCAM05973]|uniref:DUF5677 domain-containing protein n=1 Tax=Rhizobium sp. RCAM05973 TaxID=2994066 RepID=UPI0022EBC0E0|nr:DUF5677 domain-containing protein [Rhizobium sp. RCAM05973]
MSEDTEYDLEAVLEDANVGPEVSEDYLSALNMLDNVVRECMYASKNYAGIPSPAGKHFYASVLFTAMITRRVSLLNLAPHTPWAKKIIEHWDYASLAGLARTMIELRVAFFYLCVEPCSDDEWQCRWNLFNLHDCVSRRRMFEALEDEEQTVAFEKQADELRDRLKNNAHFNSLDPKKHKKLLHGQTAYLFPLEEIAEKAGLEVKMFRWLYILLSSHVHGLPMSFYRMGNGNSERGRGLPSPVEERYSSLFLSLAANMLVATRDEVHELFADVEKPATEPPMTEHAVEEVKDAVAVGETVSMEVTDQITILITRTTENTVDLAYICRADGQIVLERTSTEDEGGELKSFDPFFWTISVNGTAATEKALETAIASRHLFKVDHVERKLTFKTDE